MLKITLLELFLRGVPEGLLFIFGTYAFSKRIINAKSFIMSSILYIILVYLIRSLPIHYGVHAILNIFVLIILTVNINKISLIKSIKSGIIIIMLQFLCEGINVLIIQYVFKVDINYVFTQPVIKILYGIPSIMIFACIVIVYYITKKERVGI